MTQLVSGIEDDKFHFAGCTTKGQEAAVCRGSEGVAEGVRILRNSKKQAVGFGSCCKQGWENNVIDFRKIKCKSKPADSKHVDVLVRAADQQSQKANATEVVETQETEEDDRTGMPATESDADESSAARVSGLTGSGLLDLILIMGIVIMVLISGAMCTKYKK